MKRPSPQKAQKPKRRELVLIPILQPRKPPNLGTWDPVREGIEPIMKALGAVDLHTNIRERLAYDISRPSFVLSQALDTHADGTFGQPGPRELLRRWLQFKGLGQVAEEIERRLSRFRHELPQWEKRAFVSDPPRGSKEPFDEGVSIDSMALRLFGSETLNYLRTTADMIGSGGGTEAPAGRLRKAPPGGPPSLNETDQKIVESLAAKFPQTGREIAIAVSRSEGRIRTIFSKKLMPHFGYFNVRGQGYFPPKNGPETST